MTSYSEEQIQKNATSNIVQLNMKLGYGKFKGKTPLELITDGEIEYLLWLRSSKQNRNTGEIYSTKMSKELNIILDWVVLNSENIGFKNKYINCLVHSEAQVNEWAKEKQNEKLNSEILEFEKEIEREENENYGGW